MKKGRPALKKTLSVSQIESRDADLCALIEVRYLHGPLTFAVKKSKKWVLLEMIQLCVLIVSNEKTMLW